MKAKRRGAWRSRPGAGHDLARSGRRRNQGRDPRPARHLVHCHRGRLIKTTADSILATFDAPGQAIRCAAAVFDDAAAAGIRISAGIHTGEIDLVGDEIAGASVQITDRIARLAQPAEILVSRTVKDLVTGTGLSFTERGRHELTGLPDQWPLFAVAPGDQAVRPARR